ncbi:aldo/keto reductase [Sinomonas susongensis]|uniref:aldo/keto reductase n=1 Tax=Sinomonas susongensis TaxID=1324851 RepID=UPI0011096B7A|nr:aldo/keto reductase [Sinomonas susongensis]
MQTHTIPGTRIDLTVLGFGGAPIGNLYRQMSDADAIGAVEAAWKHGIRYFDTAPHYGVGLSERRLGEALRGVPRDDYVLSTKVGRLLRPNGNPGGKDAEGFDVSDELVRVRDYSRDGVLRSIEESLARLGTDHVEIVYIHDPDDYWPEALEGAVPALSQLRDEGVIGAYGAGMNQSEMLHRFVTETDVDVIMLAGRYTLLEQGAKDALLPACAERGVGIVNVSVFNSGLLSVDRPAPGATYNYAPAPAELLERANLLADICERHGTTLPAAALAFSFREPIVTSTLVGVRSAAEVERNVALAAQGVPDSLWTELQERGLVDTASNPGAPESPAPKGTAR